MGNMASLLYALDESASAAFYDFDKTGTIIANAREDGWEGYEGSAGGGCGVESSWGGGLPTTRLRVGLFNGGCWNAIIQGVT